MSTDNERGALGERFHDLPTPADNPDLSWEKMAPHILQPTEPEQDPEDRAVAWWWLAVAALVLLLAGGGYALRQQPDEATSQTVAQVEAPNSTAPTPPAVVSRNGMGNEQGQSESLPATRFGLEQPVRAVNNDTRSEKRAGLATAPLTAPTTVTPTEPALEGPTPQSLRQQTLTISKQAKQSTPLPSATAVARLSGQKIRGIDVPTREINAVVAPVKFTAHSGKSKAISLLAGPLSYSLGYDDPTATTQLSAQVRLGYEQSLNDRWFIATGVELRHYRFQSAFESTDENARIYQPGTVDTIFRNLTTGVETISTTDTVGGTRIRRFLNDNVVNTIGLPVILGYYHTFSNHRLSIGAGPRIDFLLNREGKVTVNNLEVIDFAEAPGLGQNLRWGGRLEAGYDWQPKGRWSLSLRVGAQTAFSDWSTDGAGQRPTSFNGMVGLRYRW